MTSKGKHQKHVSLAKPQYGEFARNELAILGTSCGLIRELVNKISEPLSSFYTLAYVDKEHSDQEEEVKNGVEIVQLLEKSKFTRFDTPRLLSAFDRRTLFNREDLVFVNGNHFTASRQIVVIDPAKNLEKRLDQLTDVKLILLKDSTAAVPKFLKEKLPDANNVPVFDLAATDKIVGWIKDDMDAGIPPVNGLVLAGGESKRMQQDKGELVYHGKNQREHVLATLQSFCASSFLSCNRAQAADLKETFPVIEDAFVNLGPMGGILSAFRHNPNAAWLTIACDLPYLSEKTIQHLVHHRNPSKVATAFLDAQGVFPEPLITIWEPRAYPVLLEYLSQGQSCPRKILINSEVEILEAPDPEEFHNVNHPGEYKAVLKDLNAAHGKVN